MNAAKRASSAKAPPRRIGHARVLVYALAAFVFVIPPFILPQATEYGYTKTILAFVLVTVLLALWGLDAWRRGEIRVRIPWIVFPFLVFVAASLFSLLGAINGRVVVQSLAVASFFFIFLLLVADTVREKRDVALLLGCLTASVSLVSLYGLLQYAGVLRGPSEGTGLNQVISTLGNKEYLSGFVAYSLFPSVILLVRLRSRALRVASVALIAFNFGTLLLVEQTGANVAMVAGALACLVGLALYRPMEPLRKARAWLLALVLACALAFLVEAPSGPLNSLVGLSAPSEGSSWIARVWEQNSGRARAWDWWIGLEMLKDSPWVGIGLGNYKLAFVPYKAKFLATPLGASYDFHIARAAQAHNEYVQAAAELGVLGIVAVLGFLIVLPTSLFVRLRRQEEAERLDLILLGAGLVVVLVHALVSFPAHLPASSLAALLTCGVALSPAYGDAATVHASLRRRGTRATVIALVAVGVGVSIVGVRDLAANVLLAQGLQELRLGNVTAATATLERSLALDFAPSEVLYYLGAAYAQQGDIEAAFESFEKCLTRFVDESTYLAYAELAVNLGRTSLAKEQLSLLLASRPSVTVERKARYVHALATSKEGDVVGATRELEALVADAPTFETARIALANVLVARGLTASARTEYEKALKQIEPRLARAEEQLAKPSTMTAAAYAELRSTIATLRTERDFVRGRLAALP
ncbi:MAG: O-antigen ligase family protein [Candidatus Bipolaricaulota bacterium]